MAKDKINPDHYKNNSIETFKAITSQFTEAETIGAIKFNIAKYIFRAGKKVQTLEGAREDVSKAHWYTEKLLQILSDLIKKRNKDPNRELTDDELEDLLNPGRVIKFKNQRKKHYDDDKDPK